MIHPSLQSAVYDHTLTFKNGEWEVLKRPIRNPGLPHWMYSSSSCWLPTDFDIAADGRSAKSVSYIGGISPSQKGLYAIIEVIVARFSTLFDRVLTDLIPGNGGWHRRVPTRYSWLDEPAFSTEETDTTFEQRYSAWLEDRVYQGPTVRAGGYVSAKNIALRKKRFSLSGRRAQIFVAFTNIHLVRAVTRRWSRLPY